MVLDFLKNRFIDLFDKTHPRPLLIEGREGKSPLSRLVLDLFQEGIRFPFSSSRSAFSMSQGCVNIRKPYLFDYNIKTYQNRN